jgi:hypothetical protein
LLGLAVADKSALDNAEDPEVEEGARDQDQGYTRPKVLILTPMRHFALKVWAKPNGLLASDSNGGIWR